MIYLSDKVYCETSVSKNETVVPQCPLFWALTTIYSGDKNAETKQNSNLNDLSNCHSNGSSSISIPFISKHRN